MKYSIYSLIVFVFALGCSGKNEEFVRFYLGDSRTLIFDLSFDDEDSFRLFRVIRQTNLLTTTAATRDSVSHYLKIDGRNDIENSPFFSHPVPFIIKVDGQYYTVFIEVGVLKGSIDVNRSRVFHLNKISKPDDELIIFIQGDFVGEIWDHELTTKIIDAFRVLPDNLKLDIYHNAEGNP